MRCTSIALGVLILVSGCAAPQRGGYVGRGSAAVRAAFPGEWRDVLESADRLHLLALDPHASGAPEERAGFHGYAVLGQAEIRDSAERRSIVEAVYRGINVSGPVAACFIPRHGLRAELGVRTIDLVICFECGFFRSYGQNPTFVGGGDSPRAVESVLDAALRRHGLPKAGD